MVGSPPSSSLSWGASALAAASVLSHSILISTLLRPVSCALFLLLVDHRTSAAMLSAIPQATTHDQAAKVIGGRSSISPPNVLRHGHRSPPLQYYQHGHVHSSDIMVRCSESERTALLQFKAGLLLDDPASSRARLLSWRGLDCCQGWEGVACDNFTGSVIRLDLRNWNLSSKPPSPSSSAGNMDNKPGNLISDGDGTTTVMFSPLLRLKSSLRYLDLSLNSFHHNNNNPIPAFFGSFEELRYLNLSHSGFAGTIPPQLGNLSRLKYLDLSDDPFSSISSLRVDSLQWVSGLSRLRYLSLDNINLSSTTAGALDWVQLLNERLPLLVELHLSHCSLGSITLSLDYTNFTSLKVIDLSYNHFSFPVPGWLPNVSSLVYLDLSNNDLRGPVPHGGFSQLHHLDLDNNNNLHASISELLGRHEDWPRINTLRMEFTNSFGEIPPSIGNITSLAQLSLFGNDIRGVIPSSIGKLHQLTTLVLGANSLMGQLPPVLWQLPELAYLDVSWNNLSGIVIEAHLSSLSAKLKMLDLGSNLLILNLSSHWIPPFQLNRLGLASCQVGPAFPSWIKSQRELASIDLGQNGISNELQTAWFWDLPSRHNLEVIDLFENNLTGSIPMSIGELQNLERLDLSSNLLTGDIPVSIGKLNKLRLLLLRGNRLTGSIPASIGEIGGLLYLDLSNNNLVGGIPASLGKLYEIRFLDLSGNKLSGNIIPTTLLNSTSLQLLNLGGNNLSGDIPMSPLGSMKDLKVLNLSGNMLAGKFPPFIRNLPHLEALDLGFNNLHGDIPAWLGEIQGLRILQLRSNRFSGGIPPQLSNLKSLQVLDLAKNNLTGLIPGQLGGLNSMLNATQLRSLSEKEIRYVRGITVHMKSLDLEFVILINKGLPVTSIDLSENKLSGRFPESLTNLSGLIALDLSRNFLTGKIPERVGNMRELESLDLSSNHFTGRVPPSMSSMSFLGSLNLSNNNLSGEIPAGGHMDTFGDASFFGNPYLCGRFIERSCVEKNHNPQQDINRGEEGKIEEDWFYLGLGPGFAFGILTPFLIVATKRGWSEAYFRVVDGIIDRLF